MSFTLVVVAYLVAFLVAIGLLYFFRARRWYWHVISVLLALVIGLIPTPEPLQSPQGNLLVGVVFTFLFFWGVGAPFFRRRKAESQASTSS